MKITNFKTMDLSKSTDYISDGSLGIVVKTSLETEKTTVGVYIPRLMMGIDISAGGVEESYTINKSKLLNSKNKNIGDSAIKVSNYIELPILKVYNMSTPMFQKGERISLNMIDQDIKSMAVRPYGVDDIKKRPTDIQSMFVPATGTTDKDDLNDENTHFIRLDSVNSRAQIHLSKSNGEVAAYDLTFDGANGILSMTDGDRAIAMATDEDVINVKTGGGAIFTMEDTNINFVCDSFNINSSNEINLETSAMNIKSDTIKTEADKFEGKIGLLKSEGDKQEFNYDKVIEKGLKRESEFPTVVYESKLFNITGVASVGGVHFKAQKGKPTLPINPQIGKDGKANFKGAGGGNLTKANELFELLTMMGAKIDALGGALGIPPSIVTAIPSYLMKSTSMTVKG